MQQEIRVFSSIMSSRTAASLVNKSSILLGILLAFSTFAFTLGQRDLELEEWALAQQQQQLQHPFAQWNMVNEGQGKFLPESPLSFNSDGNVWAKRANAFYGVRGKKPASSSSGSAFYGVRGKKATGFYGVRGKRFEEFMPVDYTSPAAAAQFGTVFRAKRSSKHNTFPSD